jgi:cell filamentation protein
MSLEGNDAFDDPYAYPGTAILKNILDIRDQDTLEAFEVEISTLRAEESLPEGKFDSAHYCSVHHHLFQDVYDWAGRYRTVRTSRQPAEKPNMGGVFRSFVTGHDFSRAANASK